MVYCDSAMRHLKQNGRVIYLKLPLEILQRRLSDISGRGTVIEPGQTLESLYEKRRPLYEKYAAITIHTAGLTHEQRVNAILRRLTPVL